jgi:hypothetical protein
MGWFAFLFLGLISWACFEGGVNTAGVLGLMSAAFFFPPIVSWIRKTDPEFDHSKRITTGCGMAVLSFIFFGFTWNGRENNDPLEQPTAVALAKPQASSAPPEDSLRSIDNDPGVAEAQHAVAGLINLNGHLCAKVENVQPLQMRDQVFEVTCTEYRGGSGRVRYLVDGSTGTASRL